METGDGGGDKQGDSGGEKRDIRRPMNAFLIFCKRHRSMVREKHPDRDNRSVTRILGDLWANLPDDEKAVYTNLAKTYKDAFMKANPDYKWHSTDRLPQPAKMATRPTNVRPPRSLSTSDALSMGHSEGDKLGGVSLLLLAGKHSMPIGDQPSPRASENDQAPPDLMGANSALLQLAEMCSSSEVAGRHMDSAALRSAPPKKRARHWSHSDVLHTDIADKTKLSPAPLLFQSALHLTKSLPPPPAATHTSQSEPVPQKQDHSYQPPNQLSAMLQRKETEQLNAFKPVNITNQITIVRNVPFQLKEEKDVSQPEVAVSIPRTETFSAEAGMPPKKKFTKLHDRYKGERPTATTATSTESGYLSDQNDNAIFTCGKLVVDHIIDRLFSANLMSSEHHEAINPSTTDIEKVRKIITADITEREKSQGPASKEMGKLLSEVVQKPQNLVEKVIEEAYNMDLKRRVKQELPFSAEPCPRPRSVGEAAETKPALVPKPAVLGKAEKFAVLEPIPEQTVSDQQQPEMKHDMATMVSTAPLPPFGASSNDDPLPSEPGYSEPVHLPIKPSILLQSGPMKDEREERFVEELVGDPSKEDGGGDYLQEEEEGYLQPVRKSRRRNRGQRYQELINEGIIQPSKERLAARRHEQVPASVSMSLSSSLFMGEEMSEEDAMMTERSRQSLKRSISEIDQGALDDKRYRTGDFDLEAEIATLPPCSLDQVPRRRGPRKRSDSENGRRPLGSPTPGQMKDESSSPEPQWGLALTSSSSTPSTTATCTSQPAASAEPLTGSQKRKARKHSINRLVASTDSGSKAKPPGIEASIPMVRDATVSPVRNVQSESTTSTRESSVSATSKSTTCLTSCASAASSLESQSSLPSNKESLPLHVHVQHGKENLVNNTDKIMKTESRFTAEKESGVEGKKTFTTEQKLAVSVCDVQTKSSVSVTADNHNTVKRNLSTVKTDFERSVEKSVAKPVSEENVDQTLTGDMHKDGGLKEDTIYATRVRSDMEEVNVKKSTTVSTIEVKTSAAAPNDSGSDVVVGQNKDISAPFTGILDNSVNQVSVEKVYGENTVRELSSSATGCGIESACPPVSLSPESGVFSENSARENVKRPKRWQLKEALSSDSGQYSSMDVCEDVDRETTPDGAEEEEEDKPCVFLSETSGLLCITQPVLQRNGDRAGMLVADVSESKEYVSQSPKSGFESACDSDDQKGSLAMGGLTPFEDREDAEVDDSALSSIVAMGMEDSLDGVRGGGVVASSEPLDAAKVDFSSFSSGATATTGPRVTTVTMTTTDAIPTALSLEMMEEEGMVDSGMGNPMLCGSPMPESPSMTAVHS